jgi:predicted TIM-barrel fold metal-dependent hydrolase
MKVTCVLVSFVAFQLVAVGQTPAVPKPPIIDVHLHAFPADWFGKPGFTFCAGDKEKVFPGIDPQTRGTSDQLESCPEPLVAPLTDEEVMRQSLAALEQYNVCAVASGPPEHVKKWKATSPQRVIPGLFFSLTSGVSPDAMRAGFRKVGFSVLGEVVIQYEGISPSDQAFEPYLALAEELDVPVGIHMGLGPPGAAYSGAPAYRASLSNPLLLEEALIRHPKLRVYLMHAGWPMLDEVINLLCSHPQVYADVAVIDWYLPRKEFHYYLRRLVEAGFGKRLMFGSDQMIWPQAIGIAIESIELADFLTAEQKRDIFYNNAARFLWLDWTPPKQGFP